MRIPMEKTLWQFIDGRGTFASDCADKINTLYFPLANSYPFMSSVTPDLHGDAKTDNNHFLLEPVSRLDLSDSKSSRNFWVYLNPGKIWSATGVIKDIAVIKNDVFSQEAGLLWHKVTRRNNHIGLSAQITSFVPASGEPVEIMRVTLTNISSRTLKLIPTAAIPIFARSAKSLRDHRHVTSLLNRTKKDKFGVIVTPTLLFDESGHGKNCASYFVLGIDEKSRGPRYIYAAREEFCGEDGDLEAPAAIFKNTLPDKKYNSQGKEAISGLKFEAASLKPGSSFTYIIVMGIAREKKDLRAIFHKFNTPLKIEKSLKETKLFWQEKSCSIAVKSADKTFDNWFAWVNIQPYLRKIFGCSFLPDFDYGKGGRGWRDLWQDCLSLTLLDTAAVRPLLVNNFAGVRVDGSCATIIGQKPGEFIADRNNISRVWMDHGIWPLITTHLYLNQSGDFSILLAKAPYFRDHQLSRSSLVDHSWSPQQGNNLKTKSGQIYQGTILEHILVQNLVQFFNVGPHNHIRLEGADWNDGLDMAEANGESVAFSCIYAQNLNTLAEILEKAKFIKLTLLKELLILLDSCGSKPINYANAAGKRQLLQKYFTAVNSGLSGKKITVPAQKIIEDLRKKADSLTRHIRQTEWLKAGFFNGYYDNDKKRLEGKYASMHMTLTGQTFPIMSGVATPDQVKTAFASARKFLQDCALGGFRLNTDFKNEQPNMGRAFSFIYGDKENGAFFNHMTVMFAYALYKRGFAKEGYEVLSSIYRMAVNTSKSKIYPCLPEYFNGQGRGMYCYLTGSASWFVFTLLTQSFGVKGEYGNLLIEPKLTAAQFKGSKFISVKTVFLKRGLEIRFLNPQQKEFGRYSIRRVNINGKIIILGQVSSRILIPRKEILALSRKAKNNIIEVVLG